MKLLLALLLACQAPSQAADTPAPTAAPTPSPSVETPMPDPRQIAEAWAQRTHPDAGDGLRVQGAGDATGHPAFVVRIGEPGQPPRTETVIVVAGDQVWTGRSGWRQFLAQDGRDDAYRTAAAWLALYRGDSQIPYGPDRKYKKKPMPAPVWKGDELELVYSGHRSSPVVVRLTIDEHDAVTIVSEKPWAAPIEF